MIAATLAGAVVFTLMSYFIMLPTPVQGTFFFPSYAVLGVFAALFGPVSGALISLSGMTVVSLLRGVFFESFTLPYTIAAALCGFIYGFARRYNRVDEGRFNDRDLIAYNVFQIGGNLAAWALTAPALQIILSGAPAREAFLSGLTASFVDILSAEFIGTPLLFVYSLIRRRQLRQKAPPRG
jgi:energy-coupling factor transport system substrate-specific component